MAQTAQNELRDPQITQDAKTQVWHNVSHRDFFGNCIGSTRARKIVHRRFTPRTHRYALRDPRIPPYAKAQYWRNMS
jgi:hypothetical protein